jgi:hypothetical protein
MRNHPATFCFAAICACLFGIGALVAVERPFVVYDNMYYKGKPDTVRSGLVESNIVYENKIWPNKRDVGGCRIVPRTLR